ncbi:MAG: aminotransferase class V-fold PLP-dependent enzyme [Frisingicoccus sp.]|uniref:aminotransferase class V-fold PLP-dependent enzyme n=1 Tax=Frisingicoccus sp. TaxID=1918627 RepID=UPI002A83358A|nr:aminotransferase class V-fold PLP-dependent enzyme [Frisingicoccus sp.]MDY4835772.1 aminotransferase class V-fold PLP-dependent enzyme [Frisingicoccus sp.]
MCTVYLDQVAKPFPMADGAEAAGKQAVSMDKENLQAMIQNTKEQLNSLFHGPGADYVVFTEGVGAAFDKTLRSILKKGDHVLVSPMESDAVMNILKDMEGNVAYSLLPCNEKGQLVLFDEEKGEKGFEAVERLMRPNTKAIIINHASEVCGTVLQVKEMAEFARRKNLLMIANTAQTAAFVPIFMNIWGIDILTFSGGYGLLASEKIGGFIASEKACEFLGGKEGLQSFEMNPLDIERIGQLSRAFEFIKETRLFNLCSTAQKRAEQFIRKVQHVNGVHIIGPGYKDRIPVVSIQTDFMDEKELEEALKKQYSIVIQSGLHGAEQAHKTLGTWPRGTARFSFTYFNTESDIDKITQALWQLTVHSDKVPDVKRMPKE